MKRARTNGRLPCNMDGALEEDLVLRRIIQTGLPLVSATQWLQGTHTLMPELHHPVRLLGSSAGSAVAVSAGFAPASLGSETCGSICCPADLAVSDRLSGLPGS